MPLGKRTRDDEEGAPLVVRGDPFTAIPDAILHHVLSFLPAQEAVRTCLVARRWRHLWKSTTGLRLRFDGEKREAAKKFQVFVDHLLLFRGRVPIETFDLRFGKYSSTSDGLRVSFWIRHALLCEVRMLRIESTNFEGLLLERLPLVSRHLTRLELHRVDLNESICDFSHCPFLEQLHISRCYLDAMMSILSGSLKHLTMKVCCFQNVNLNVPSVVSLWLEGQFLDVPVLHIMPSLQEACIIDYDVVGDYDKEYCHTYCIITDRENKCFPLQRISQVKKLALISEPNMYIFREAMEHYPTFGKLKTLLLNECWCVAPHFFELTCILKHSPVLEKLTLQLFSKGPKHNVEIIGGYNPVTKSATISEHLRIIEVKCQVVDENVHKLLKYLGTFNIYFLFK